MAGFYVCFITKHSFYSFGSLLIEFFWLAEGEKFGDRLLK